MSAIARCFHQILLLFALLGQPVSAADLTAGDLADEDVDVSYRDGTYSARLSFPVAATPSTALAVLTDFDHMVGVVPNLESSRIVSRTGRIFIIEQRGKADFGPFSVRFESRRRVELFPDGRLVADAGQSTQAQITAALSSAQGQSRQQHGGAAHVLGPLGQFVLFRRGLVDDGLDRRIEDLDDQDQQDAADHQARSMPVLPR
jgi:hypothetical protein